MSSPIPVPKQKVFGVSPLNFGVFLDRSPMSVPDGGMTNCRNVRIKEGFVTNENIGWSKFHTTQFGSTNFAGGFVVGEPITMIDSFVDRTGASVLMIGTQRDLARWDGSEYVYLTPIRTTPGSGANTVVVGGTTVTGTGTAFVTDGVAAGDRIYVGAAGFTDVDPGVGAWYDIASVDSELQLTVTESFTIGSPFSYTIRENLPGPSDSVWSAAMFPDAQPQDEDTWYGTNGTSIVKWDGSAAELTNITSALGFSCDLLHFYKNQMLYGNLLESGERKPTNVRNSALANPENVTTDEAGEWTIAEGVDPLLRFETLGDYIVGYCERSINIAQFADFPIYYAIRTSVPAVGLIGQGAVAHFGDYHEFLSHDRAYRFDGVSVAEVGGQVFRDALRQFDLNRDQFTSTLFDEESGELHWIVPQATDEGDGPVTAYTSHYLEQVGNKPQPITIRDLPATASGFWLDSSTKLFSDLTEAFTQYHFAWNDRFFTSAFPQTLFGDENGFVYVLGTVNNQDGGAIDSWARFQRRPTWDGVFDGVLTQIEPFAKRFPAATYGLGCIYWGTDFAEGDLVKLAQEDFDLTHSGNRFVAPLVEALYGEVEFATNAVDAPWSVSGYRLVASQGGRI